MKTSQRHLLTFAIAAGASLGAAAQPAAGSSAPASSPWDAVSAAADRRVDAPSAGATALLSTDELKAEASDFAQHLKWQRRFARESWDWHLFSTKLLMYVVLAIVAFGLLLTYIQFTRDGRGTRRRRAPRAVAASSEPTPAQEGVDPTTGAAARLKLDLTGIEITSQVIGLLVLTFSLAFFYLYVKEVYPVQELELQRHAKTATETSNAAK